MKLKEKVLGILKKKGGVPDVGQEESEALGEQLIGTGEEEEKAEEEAVEEEEAVKEDVAPVKKVKTKKVAKGVDEGEAVSVSSVPVANVSAGGDHFEVEKINGKIEMLDSLIKGVNERLSVVGQQVGEVRNMAISNEKVMAKSDKDSLKAVDIVKEVKPEELRVAYQKTDLKIQTLNEKLEANKEFNDTLMNEIKDLKGKAGLFVGTDGVLKLNEDVKKDLVEVQKLASKVRLNADKSEQIFMEVRKGFAESQKLNEIFNGLDSSYSGLREQVEKMKVDFSSLVDYKDFTDNQKKMDSNFAALEDSLNSLDDVKKNNDRLTTVIEKVFVMEKNNEKDIANLAVTLGDTKIKKASDYEERFRLLLKIVEDVSGELSKIKKKIGGKGGKGLSKKVISDMEKIVESVEDVEVEPISKKSANVVSKADATKALETVEGENKNKKSFFKKLFGSKGGSPLEADQKSSEAGDAVESAPKTDAPVEAKTPVEEKAPVEAEKTEDEPTPVEEESEVKEEPVEVAPETEKTPEGIREEKEIDNIAKQKEATMTGIDESAVGEETKIDNSLKGIQSEIGKLKGSSQKKIKKIEIKKGEVKKIKKKKVVKSKKVVSSAKKAVSPVKKVVKKKVVAPKGVPSGAQEPVTQVPPGAKKQKRSAKKAVSPVKKVVKKKVVDKRLKSLAKARKVHMKNVVRKNKIKSDRLKSLAKARRVHMSNLKEKKKALKKKVVKKSRKL